VCKHEQATPTRRRTNVYTTPKVHLGGESVRLVCMSGVVLFHGIVPWIWDWRFSAYLDNAHKRIKSQTATRKKNLAKKN
jgi:hypothetical protein